MMVEAIDHNTVGPARRIDRRRVMAVLLVLLLVLSGVAFPPWVLVSYAAGFLKSQGLLLLFLVGGFALSGALLLTASLQFVRLVLTRRKMEALFWAVIALAIVLAFVLQVVTSRSSPDECFGHGLIRRLNTRSDVDAIQIWVESPDFEKYGGDPRVRRRERPLRKEEQPEVLKHQDGMVGVELDASGRPYVRLRWDEGKGGAWGLVIGRRDMKTPPSEPGMYGERRTELRPGIYFWYREA